MPQICPTFKHSEIIRDERGVYTLSITNAKSMNVLASDVTLSVTEAVRWVSGQADARAVILRGSGEKAFIGGANIYELTHLNPESARQFITQLRALCDAIMAVPVPTVARVSGFCLGAGVEVAAACDIRLGSRDAVFGLPEVRVGIPSVIHAVLLPQLIGVGHTNWLLLTGSIIDAEVALRWGLLDFSCDAGGLDGLVEETIAAIASSGPIAIRSQKKLLQYWRSASTEAGIDRSVAAFGEAFTTDEPQRYMEPFTTRNRSGRAIS